MGGRTYTHEIKAVTNGQNIHTRELAPTQSKQNKWPMFEDDVYPPIPIQ